MHKTNGKKCRREKCCRERISSDTNQIFCDSAQVTRNCEWSISRVSVPMWGTVEKRYHRKRVRFFVTVHRSHKTVGDPFLVRTCTKHVNKCEACTQSSMSSKCTKCFPYRISYFFVIVSTIVYTKILWHVIWPPLQSSDIRRREVTCSKALTFSAPNCYIILNQ